jgi:hypothetical protein
MPLPPLLRPALVVRRKALRHGLLGDSRFWKVVAYGILSRMILRRMFGRHPEVIETAILRGPGHVMRVETMSRDEARRRTRAGR